MYYARTDMTFVSAIQRWYTTSGQSAEGGKLCGGDDMHSNIGTIASLPCASQRSRVSRRTASRGTLVLLLAPVGSTRYNSHSH